MDPVVVSGTHDDLTALRNDLSTNSDLVIRQRSRQTSLIDRQVDHQVEVMELVIRFAVTISAKAAYDIVKAAVIARRKKGAESLDIEGDQGA